MKNLKLLFVRVYKEYPIKFPVLLGLMTITGVLEGIGLSMFVPLLNLVFKGEGYHAESIDKITETFIYFTNSIGLKATLANVLFFIFIVFLLQSMLKLGQNLFEANIHVDFHGRLIRRLYNSYLEASWPYFYEKKMGDLINNITLEGERAAAAEQFLAKMLAEVFIAAFYIFIILFASWKLTLGGLAVGIFASLFLRGIINRAHGYGKKITYINKLMQSEIGDKLSAAKMIKASATEKKANDRLEEIVKKRLKYRFKSLKNAYLIPAYYLPVVMGTICSGIYISFTYFNMSFPIIVLFLLIFYRLMPKFQSIQDFYHQTILYIPGLLEVDKTLKEAELYKEEDGGSIIDSLRSSIEFKKVNYSYSSKEKGEITIKDMSMVIEKGKVTAIVGSSGAGKSTLVDLILGLLSPQSGGIFIDGKPLDQIHKKSWRGLIGYVSQDIHLFNDTIQNNITWCCPEASIKEVEEASRMAYAHEFILKLPDEYQTLVGDRGVKLSGGQRQRISLARAILKKPQILILDEATSALDTESEKKIQKAVDSLSKKITVVIISHRLSTLRSADNIYVVENGTIIESGEWNELIKRDGMFKQLTTMQNLQ